MNFFGEMLKVGSSLVLQAAHMIAVGAWLRRSSLTCVELLFLLY